ncbi:MAG: sulfatase-like hydrolase/transferase [Clostridiales bacterium]|nr:sulfatase-like hydrolase/transferase [Clostridiales bacterium]
MNEEQNTIKEKARRFFTKLGTALLEFAKRNYLMCAYVLAAVFIELTGIAVTAGKFYMTAPWIYLTLLALVCLISQFLPGHKSRYAVFLSALIINFILDLVFIVVFDSTGGTVFDYAMLNLRQDAMMIVESLPFSFTYIFVSGLIIALYGTIGFMMIKRMPAPKTNNSVRIATASLLSVVVGGNVLLSYFSNYRYDSNDLRYMLYQTETGTYSNKGIVGNFYNELVRGIWFSDIDIGDRQELHDFIYQSQTEPTACYGKASDYNVITMLCESFEWFTFLYDAERYPNGYARSSAVKANNKNVYSVTKNLKVLFPNLYRLYEGDSTVVLDNSYSLNKTDISENESIIGCYPLYEYINYSYPKNTLPFSLPNILKNLYGVESNSFHDGYRTFYNRNVHHVNALGFNSYTAAEDMSFKDDDTGLGERNLDSQMIDSTKEKMFPNDRRFNTFITTITQHGQYAYRDNLKEYYNKMDALGILPYIEDDDDANALRFYCAAGMDLDKAIGIMLDYLENTDCVDEHGVPLLDSNGKRIKLADRTLLTIFGDHNCYYQGVSNYVKNIYSPSASNYTELYRVPVMMKVGNQKMGNPHIKKFTCVLDIYPTILDLLGITVFSNLTYGVSAFSEEQSILYSRAYNKFLTDKIYFNSMSNLIYKAPGVDSDYVDYIEEKATGLLEKISHINRIFAADFFKADKGREYYNRLKSINDDLTLSTLRKQASAA